VSETLDRAGLVELLTEWTDAAARLTQGLEVAEGGATGGSDYAPPVDTGEALGLPASGLTITFGFGPGLFTDASGADRFGLASRRPAALEPPAAFQGDALQPERSGGDLCIQACADDPQVAVHAIRNLSRIAFGRASLRWSQLGFGRTSSRRRRRRRRATCSGSRTAPRTSRPRSARRSPSTSGAGRRPAPHGSRAARTSSPGGSA
jgi:deferrochelatase/peroxidase EfeB